VEKKEKTIRTAIFLIFFTLITTQSFAQDRNLEKYWQIFKKNFFTQEYIDDKYYKFATHSEAQGTGLLFSEYFNDYQTFIKIWKWTKNNLQVRKNDHLFAWLWGKTYKGSWEVLDYNNASDADIMIAWALLKAGKRWEIEEFTKEAIQIINDIKKKLIVKWNGFYILLPGYTGFIKGKTITVNPSYYITPAFKDFYKITKEKVWLNLIEDKKIFLNYHLGRFHLIPDWIELTKDPCYQVSRKYVFGYEAIRFYLYNKDDIFQKDLSYFINFFLKRGKWIPDKVFLNQNLISINDSPAGFYAVYAINCSDQKFKKFLSDKAKEKLKYDKSYYSLSLYILAHIIQ